MAAKLPHILLFVTDQFRHDAFSPKITPNLYSLSQSSTKFVNAYTSTPTCTPARAGLLTGKSPWHHGMLGYANSVDCTKYPTTLPSVLTELLGYDSYIAGKNHFGTYPDGHAFVDHGYQHMRNYEGLTTSRLDDYQVFFNETYPGMDPHATCDLGWNEWRSCPYWYEEYAHPTNWTTRRALRFLEDFDFSDSSSDRPLFLKVSYHRPHSPYDPPRRLFDKHLNAPPVDRFINNSAWDKQFLNDTAMPRGAWHGDPGADAARHSRAGYLASAEYVDEGVGLILAWLERRGLTDHFFVAHTSDHGDMLGDHNLWRKGYPYEASSRLHFSMKLPSQREGAVSRAIVENRDIAVTLYDMLGVLDRVRQMDPLVNGKSLLGILRGDETSVRQWLDMEHSIVYDKRIHWNAIVGFHEGSLWKYIFRAYDGEEQLFNLSRDPNESHDLADAAGAQDVLGMWKTLMIRQFEEEDRGEHWLKDGRLVVRGTESVTLGPLYPCKVKHSIKFPTVPSNLEQSLGDETKVLTLY